MQDGVFQKNWHQRFDNRQVKEIEFSLLYASKFRHGTEGHNAKLIIAQLATALNQVETILKAEGDSGDKLHQIGEIMRVNVYGDSPAS